jgi:hypothetical protein
VIVQPESALGGDLVLPALDVGVYEFLDAPAAQADEVIVVRAFVQFEHRATGLEVCDQESACSNWVNTR